MSREFKGCRNFDGDICIECSFRFYFDENKVCRQVNDLCRTWDEENGDCLSCYGGYVLDAGRCLIDAQFNPGG